MKLTKVPALVLAVALQVLPITRVFVAATPAAGSSYAIISTWIAGAVALLGSYHAVSGASSISISPTSATTGVPYSGIVQYSGAHASSAKSWQLINNWKGVQSGCNTVYEIAPGLWLTNAPTYIVRVGGTPTTSGTFSFTMRIHSASGCGSGDSDTRSASITVSGGTATAPTITTQPVGQTVTVGGNASFNVVASGTAPLNYQWRLNGANLSGATASTLNLTGVSANQAGSYTVVVNNSSGSVTSSPAILVVNPASVPPSITTQPTGQTVTAGANVLFSVTATGTAPLNYQWRLNGANLSGANSSTLNLTGVSANQAGTYTVVVNNSGGSVTSSPAVLIVNQVPVPPAITTQPAGQTVTAGGNVSFSTTATGTAPLNYQWQLNGANLPGATSSTLNLIGVATNQAGSYTVVVNNSAGSVTSSPAILVVNPPPVPPSITAQPVGQTVTAGADVSFSVTASGTAPLNYQWRRNGANLSGANSSTLNLTGITTNQAGSYTVVVNNSAGSITSSPAILTVNLLPVAPTITAQPAGQTAVVGGNASFSVTAAGTAPLGYQWRLNDVDLSGATSSSLNLTGLTANQAGAYTVVVNNSVGSITSSPALLVVNPAPVPPSIITQPVSQTLTNGGTASFSVVATGTSPLTYRWRTNGVVLAGATNATLVLPGVTAARAGNYSVVVANSSGSVTSSVAVLTVLVPPSITIQPTSRTVSAGGNATFSVVATGTAPLSYQWLLNGADVPGANGSVLNLIGVTEGQAGDYTVFISNAAGSVSSIAAVLTVTVFTSNSPPSISVIDDQVIAVNTATPPIPFTIGDAETAASNLTVYASSSNPSLVPGANIAMSGSDSNRTVTVTPSPEGIGSAIITVSVSDGAATNSSSFTITVQSPSPTTVVLKKNGSGTVSPDVGGMNLTVGRTYRVTAYAATGFEFSGWTGSFISSIPMLTFVMASNLVLEANFIPSPYIPVAGIYNGLFYESDEVRQNSAGSFKVSVNTRGNYSGSLRLGSSRYSFTGKLGLDLQTTKAIARPRTNTLGLALRFGSGNELGKVFGQLSDSHWTSVLEGDRAMFNARTNPASFAGKYTMVVPTQPGDSLLPSGDGYGTVNVTTSGSAVFSGRLADGTPVSQSGSLSQQHYWPFHAALYRGGGSLLGWLAFTNEPTDDLSGTLSWIKPPKPTDRYYPTGFTNRIDAVGSFYIMPVASGKVLAMTNAAVAFIGGNLSRNVTNSIIVGPVGSVITLEENDNMSVAFSASRGTYTGRMKDRRTGNWFSFQGVVLQKRNVGLGFLLGTNQSSKVVIEAQTNGVPPGPGNDD